MLAERRIIYPVLSFHWWYNLWHSLPKIIANWEKAQLNLLKLGHLRQFRLYHSMQMIPAFWSTKQKPPNKKLNGVLCWINSLVLRKTNHMLTGCREASEKLQDSSACSQYLIKKMGNPFPLMESFQHYFRAGSYHQVLSGIGAVSAEYTRKGLHYWWTSEKRQERNSPKPLSQWPQWPTSIV